LATRRSKPLGPLPALAPSLWTAETGSPDGPGTASLARPVREAGSDLWHTVAAYPGMGHAEHLIASGDGTVLHAETFPLAGAPLLHAVAVTARHLVVLDLPVAYSRAAELVGARSPYVWRPERPARIGLLPRWSPGAEPRWFPVSPCYVFQTVNAHEDGDRVVLDAVRHERAFDTEPASTPPQLHRWVLDRATGTVCEKVLATGVDAAVVDERAHGTRHHVIFGSSHTGSDGGAIVRHDLATGRTRRAPFGRGWTAGQPVFVPGTRGPDLLLVVARHAGLGRCELRVLDAAAPDLPPLATVHLPVELPTDRSTAWI
ncbi:MAG: carotenoid oxygenase family protein, partial [Spirillospora sp.]